FHAHQWLQEDGVDHGPHGSQPLVARGSTELRGSIRREPVPCGESDRYRPVDQLGSADDPLWPPGSAEAEGRGGLQRHPLADEVRGMKARLHLQLAGLALCVLGSMLPPAFAQNVLVRGGTLIDGTGRAPLADASVLITDGVIAGVWSGNAAAPAIPQGTPVIEAKGQFIIPGLIDSHVHY